MRTQRRALGVTQQKLAAALGLALAQVRKYEASTNRVSASRLQQIALALKVTPAFFFELAPAPKIKGVRVPARIKDFVSSPQGTALARAFAMISDGKLRCDIVTLVGRFARL
jgi:transcriptional regulator with XRE-family HTH domain